MQIRASGKSWSPRVGEGGASCRCVVEVWEVSDLSSFAPRPPASATMADEKELKAWVAAELHNLVGFSQSTVVSYILAVAKKHSSADSLAVVLRQQGLPAGSETNAFASQLLKRLPRKGSSAAGPSVHEQQAKALIKKNSAYGLIEDEEEDRPAAKSEPAAAAAASAPSKGKERHARTKRETSVEDDRDGGAMLPQGKRPKRAWEEDEEEGPAEREERLAAETRERDKREKEEFEARLRLRDETKTKKLAPEEKLSREEQKEQERRKWVPPMHACMRAWVILSPSL